jgi:hypothetical protein
MNKVDILDEREAAKRLAATAETFDQVRAGLNAVIFGQDQVIEQTLITLLAGGHALLIGVPGLAKTKLVDTLGKVLGLDAKRIQFTPDLMPVRHHRLGSAGRKHRAAHAPSASSKARSSPSC